MHLPLPIKPVRVDVVGIHPVYSRLLVLHMELDQTPPPGWVQCFEQAGAEMPWEELTPPRLVGSRLILHPTDDNLEQEVAHAEERIRLANQRWCGRMADDRPTIVTQAPVMDDGEAMFSPEIRERITSARRRTERMSEAFMVQGFWRSDAWVAEDLLALDAVTQN